jgi:adenylosuccinate lyase
MAEIKTPKSFNHLTAISSLDGRFRGRVEFLSDYFSEFATIKGRVFVEIEYLISFFKQVEIPLSKRNEVLLRSIHQNFTNRDAEVIWKKDEEINHDTKAVEYLLQKKLRARGLAKYINYLHFGLTSTDIDNTALAISLKAFNHQVLIPQIVVLTKSLFKMARENKDLVMPARTHGQIAVPTTAGKELANFRYRLSVQLEKLKKYQMGSKMTGAVGNYNALVAAYPNINWPNFSRKFLRGLGLENYPLSTQVEPYDHKVEYVQAVKRINYIIIALAEDIWKYLALGYLSLRDDKGHVGSSTMPQKINPIGFEMAESYCSLSNGILDVLEKKLPINRWQRDLTDKYILRDLGQALSMSTLAYESANQALQQIGFNKALIENELDNHWELIAEGIQTILRTTNYTQPYEKLKELTRGKVVTKESYEKFIEEIKVPEEIKRKLRTLTPKTYIGLAKKLAESS